MNFDYYGKDAQICKMLININNTHLGANIGTLLSAMPYEDTVYDLELIKKAYEELKSSMDFFKNKLTFLVS